MDEILVAEATRVVVTRHAGVAEVLGEVRPPRVAIITQPGAESIARGIAAGLSMPVEVLVVPDGEAAKTLEVVGAVIDGLVGFGLDRSGLLIGVGGGAVTDLAGFVASIYLRGVRVHHVPTTLLAAVDAAIGGKNGVNAGAKNLIGTFRHAARVVIDLAVLDDLPDGLRREGSAEALKAGLIADPHLVALYERHGLAAPLEEVVPRAVRVKAAVVGRDFTEQGERAHLNYGHTIGHAVEVAGARSHGQAVAIGMVAAGRASALVAGFAEEERQREVIARLGLPVSAPDVDAARVLSLVRRDKKRSDEGIIMVLLAAIGRPEVSVVAPTTVQAALGAIGIEGDL